MNNEWENLLAAVAQKNGVSQECVEKELNCLIDTLWNEGGKPQECLRQAGWGNKPTPFQLISYLAQMKQEG